MVDRKRYQTTVAVRVPVVGLSKLRDSKCVQKLIVVVFRFIQNQITVAWILINITRKDRVHTETFLWGIYRIDMFVYADKNLIICGDGGVPTCNNNSPSVAWPKFFEGGNYESMLLYRRPWNNLHSLCWLFMAATNIYDDIRGT